MANLARKLSNTNRPSQNNRVTPQNNESNKTGDKNKVKTSSKPKLVRRHSITICESIIFGRPKVMNLGEAYGLP